MHGVTLVGHETGKNKWDKKMGVTTIADHYRHGRVRLPGATAGDKQQIEPLRKQVTTWPRMALTDQVMANWFLEVKLPHIPKSRTLVTASEGGGWRPSWLKG